MRRFLLPGIWLFLVVATAVLVVARGTDAFRVETNLMALLPVVKQDVVLQQAKQSVSASAERKLLFLVESDSLKQAKDNIQNIEERLHQSGLFTQIGLTQQQAEAQTQYQQLYSYRYQLLADATRQQLEQDPDLFVREALHTLYSPAGYFRTASLSVDPLYLFGSYLQQAAPTDARIEDGVLLMAGTNISSSASSALLIAEIKNGAFDLQQQSQLLALVDELKTAYEQEGIARLSVAGMPLYAASGAERAQSEISIVGVGSGIGIVLLLLLTFRSIRPLLLAIVAVATGVFGAWAIGTAIFGKLHILTLVFGASLIGVSIDYCMHYFCGWQGSDEHGRRGIRSVVGGITLALVTSCTAYLSLSIAPFPGLQQMALFSVVGLLFSWLTVVGLFPLLMGKRWQLHQQLTHFANVLVSDWGRLVVRWRWAALVLVVFMVFGALFLGSNDDVRHMQTPSAELRAQDLHIQSVIPNSLDSRFFVVRAATPEQVLLRERAFRQELDQLINKGEIQGYQSLTQQFTSYEQQKQNYQLVAQSLYESQRVRGYLETLGFDEQSIANEYRAFSKARNLTLAFEQWHSSQPAYLRLLWLGCSAGECASIIRLMKVLNPSSVAELANGEDVQFVDPVQQSSQLMAEYRAYASWLLFIGVTLGLLLIVWRCGWRRGICAALVPVMAIALTLGLLGWIGESLNLFRVFALLLVLGIGADFGIFAVQRTTMLSSTALAITLSALTTLLAFGLLSLSSTAVVSSFGQTLLIGILMAFALAPVAAQLQNKWTLSDNETI